MDIDIEDKQILWTKNPIHLYCIYLFNTSNIVKTIFACILRILANITQIVTQTKNS